MKKKLAYLLLACSLVLGLVACGNKEEEAPVVEEPVVEDTVTVEEPEVEEETVTTNGELPEYDLESDPEYEGDPYYEEEI